MKKYRVNVNGTAYEVEIEEMAGAPVAAPVAAPAAAPAPAASGAGESINAPMPGNILSVNVAAGDTVKKGQVGVDVAFAMDAAGVPSSRWCGCQG